MFATPGPDKEDNANVRLLQISQFYEAQTIVLNLQTHFTIDILIQELTCLIMSYDINPYWSHANILLKE